MHIRFKPSSSRETKTHFKQHSSSLKTLIKFIKIEENLSNESHNNSENCFKLPHNKNTIIIK
jgi:hypothetical protein